MLETSKKDKLAPMFKNMIGMRFRLNEEKNLKFDKNGMINILDKVVRHISEVHKRCWIKEKDIDIKKWLD